MSASSDFVFFPNPNPSDYDPSEPVFVSRSSSSDGLDDPVLVQHDSSSSQTSVDQQPSSQHSTEIFQAAAIGGSVSATKPIPTDPVNVVYAFDTSGSMEELLPKAIRNFNTEILATQKELYLNATDIDGIVQPQELCLVSMIQFSGCHQITTLFQDVPIQDIQPIAQNAMHAAGMTALRTMIRTVDNMLPNLKYPRRKTMIIVFTDGEDTNSFSYDSVERIQEIFAKYERTKEEDPKHCRSLTLIGSNQDAVLTGGKMGLPQTSALTFCDDNIGDAMSSVGRMLSRVVTGSDNFPSVDDTDRERSCPSSQ